MFLRYNLPGIVWGFLIMFILGIPGDDLPKGYFINIPHLDKLVHAFLFLIFVLLLIYGYTKQYRFNILNHYSFVLSIISGVLYGGITEILQGSVFQGRTTDFFDFLADIAGCFSGLFIALLLRHKFLQSQKLRQL